jgi:hypothetical protein
MSPDRKSTNVDSESAASVRVAMTAASNGEGIGNSTKLSSEKSGLDDTVDISFSTKPGRIYSDLRIGADLTSSVPLQANYILAGTGLILGSRGFVITEEEAAQFRKYDNSEKKLIFPLRTGRDLADKPRNVFVIDTDGWTEEELASKVTPIYQHLRDRVYPERQANRDEKLRRYWWLFRRSNEQVRNATKHLSRYIVTPETVKHRVFNFLLKTLSQNMV